MRCGNLPMIFIWCHSDHFCRFFVPLLLFRQCNAVHVPSSSLPTAFEVTETPLRWLRLRPAGAPSHFRPLTKPIWPQPQLSNVLGEHLQADSKGLGYIESDSCGTFGDRDNKFLFEDNHLFILRHPSPLSVSPPLPVVQGLWDGMGQLSSARSPPPLHPAFPLQSYKVKTCQLMSPAALKESSGTKCWTVNLKDHEACKFQFDSFTSSTCNNISCQK